MERFEITRDVRDYRFISYEMEILGRRLDAARQSKRAASSMWGKLYWQDAIARLERQWRRTIELHDAQATHTRKPQWVIKYDYFEGGDGFNGHNNVFDRFFGMVLDKCGYTPDLSESWERAIRTRYNKTL
jgi:hypothetical protein